LIGFDIGVGQDIDALADLGYRQSLAGDSNDNLLGDGILRMSEDGQSQKGGGKDKGGFAIAHEMRSFSQKRKP
jgi:hypothetical protein